MKNDEVHSEVIKLIKEKSTLKRDVFDLTTQKFEMLKTELKKLTEVWKEEVRVFDPRLEIEFQDLGTYFCEQTIAGDTLLFSMHTNVFKFAENSMYWNSGYLQDDPNRGFCGVINVYNFLADSLRFKRQNDLGYLVARIFINHENHFFVEGKKQLGYLFNDFINSEFTPACAKKILMSIVLYTLEFDLFTPEYRTVQEVSLQDITMQKDSISLKTGKRLGFQLGYEGDDPVG